MLRILSCRSERALWRLRTKAAVPIAGFSAKGTTYRCVVAG